MILINTIEEAREEIRSARREDKTIGFVPTMGAFHRGHMALINAASEKCDYVAVSIFVNPTQFGLTEDYKRYPRGLDSDAAKCERAGVDLLFAPSADEMYPDGFNTWIEVGGLAQILEGKSRPGHFRGVATVCAKLFNIVQPDRAFFGTKDYQQLKVIEKMVRDLSLSVCIVPVETVREVDGLAMSSRNQYLSAAEREAALVLHYALEDAKKAFKAGEKSAHTIQLMAENFINAEHPARIDYVAVVDAETLQPITRIDRPTVVLLAVRIGTTRLIDNTLLE
ncbi:MAG: pantoate--beta-alanine ligase [Armatimonadetes bacterium RBG_16_58_9]|nr:MAG: pantoate--beta-alanine ligase [Armatimonadetes bacterium RBG_16_58_9]